MTIHSATFAGLFSTHYRGGNVAGRLESGLGAMWKTKVGFGAKFSLGMESLDSGFVWFWDLSRRTYLQLLLLCSDNALESALRTTLYLLIN
jgi:hypothetical protein